MTRAEYVSDILGKVQPPLTAGQREFLFDCFGGEIIARQKRTRSKPNDLLDGIAAIVAVADQALAEKSAEIARLQAALSVKQGIDDAGH